MKEGMHGERCYHNINKYGGVNLTISFSDSDSPLPLVTLHVVKSKNTRQSHKAKKKKKKKKKKKNFQCPEGQRERVWLVRQDCQRASAQPRILFTKSHDLFTKNSFTLAIGLFTFI